jgi:hypothetical protein
VRPARFGVIDQLGLSDKPSELGGDSVARQVFWMRGALLDTREPARLFAETVLPTFKK